jgi:hypothetical protein
MDPPGSKMEDKQDYLNIKDSKLAFPPRSILLKKTPLRSIMSLENASTAKTLLARHRVLSPSASIKVSPICLGTMNFGEIW